MLLPPCPSLCDCLEGGTSGHDKPTPWSGESTVGSTVAGMALQLRALALPEDMGSLPSTCVGLTPSVTSLPGNLTSLLASTGTAHT